MKGCIVATLLLLLSTSSFALTNTQCAAAIVFYESNLESQRGQKAVLDVVENRMKKQGKSACQIMKQPKQFSFVKKGRKIVVDKAMITQYHRINKMNSVLGEDYLFFHSVNIRPSWARNMHCKRIGQHKFCREIREK